jgi:hypothetical protein
MSGEVSIKLLPGGVGRNQLLPGGVGRKPTPPGRSWKEINSSREELEIAG